MPSNRPIHRLRSLRYSEAAVPDGTMEVLRHPGPGDSKLARAVLTLGNFDGVHRGHQAILRRAITIARAHGARAGLLTFYPHPVSVLTPERAPRLIVPLRGKLELLAASGIDFVWMIHFSRRFAQLQPEVFIRQYVMSRVGIAAMVVGYNVTFGRNRSGDARVLADIGERMGFLVETVGPVSASGERVSSTAVRAALEQGDVARAARLLGRPHSLWGRVGPGERRGRELGFPTANITPNGGLVPLDGVYAVRAYVSDGRFPGIANVGYKPTFGGRVHGVEVHLFDFEGDLYRQRLRVEFIERLRGERRFPSAEALVEQIGRDVERALAVLGGTGGTEGTDPAR